VNCGLRNKCNPIYKQLSPLIADLQLIINDYWFVLIVQCFTVHHPYLGNPLPTSNDTVYPTPSNFKLDAGASVTQVVVTVSLYQCFTAQSRSCYFSILLFILY